MSDYFDGELKRCVIKATPTRAKPRARGKTLVGVHYSDLHIPYHHPAALSILHQLIIHLQPDLIVDQGDTLDAYSISKYEKDPDNRSSLANELQMGSQHFAQIQSIAPNSDFHWVGGNHEDRLRRLLWRMSTVREMREVMTLPQVKAALHLPRLLGIEERWSYTPYGGAKLLYGGKLLATHGNVVRKAAGASAKAELDRYGKSGLSGHTHRQGSYRNRDYNGSRVWHELGCMCELDPGYANMPDWHLGFAVVTYHLEQELFNVEKVVIEENLDGSAVGLFRDVTFHAPPSDPSTTLLVAPR